MEFKDNLKKLRIENALTQKQFAQELNIPQSTVCKFETGKLEPNIKMLIKISYFFNISIDELVGRDA